MKPEIEKYENRKSALRVAINVLTLPSWHSLLLDKIALQTRILAYKLKDRLQAFTGSSAVGDIPNPNRLPEDHPLAEMARDIAAKDGILPVVFMENDPVFHNAHVSRTRTTEGQDVAVITFMGNPLLVENGESIARGTLGHEIAHLSTSMDSSRKKYLMNSTSTYALLAYTTGFLGLASDRIKTLDVDRLMDAMQLPAHASGHLETLLNTAAHQPLMLGAAAGFAALATALPRIARSHSHATEHIADLHGAELTSPEDAIATMEYFKTREEAQKTGGLKGVWDRVVRNLLSSPLDQTHPDAEKRIKVLKAAFHMADSADTAENPAIAGRSSPGIAEKPGFNA